MQLACGGFDTNFVACDMAVQTSAEGRIVGNSALHGVCLLRTNDGVCFLIVFIKVANLDNAAECDCAIGGIRVGPFNYLCIFK